MSDSWPTNQSLIQRVQDPNNENAWDEFSDYYKDFINFVLNRLGYYGNAVDDLNQEVMMAIWKSLKERRYNKDRSKFRTWLSKIIKYKLIDYYRKKSTQDKIKQRFLIDKGDEYKIDDHEFDAMIEHEWEVHIIKIAVKNISSSYSEQALQTLNLALDGLSDQEIADKMDMKTNTINKLKNRIQKRLTQEIEVLKQELEAI